MKKTIKELLNLQEINHAPTDMNGLTKAQKEQIVTWIAVAISNSFHKTGQENSSN